MVMIQVSRAGVRHADAVFGLASAFATSFTVNRAAFQHSFDIIREAEDAVLLVADDNDRIVGYTLAFTHQTFFANGPVGWIEELMVAPDSRRAGIGRLLVASIEQWARERGVTMIALATRRARRFWESVGYEPSATYMRKTLVNG